MNWLLRLIDQDVVDYLNGMLDGSHPERSRGRQFADLIATMYRPRPTWLLMMTALFVLSVPFAFLKDPVKTYWLIVLLASTLGFFGLYIWRLALARKRFLDKREVDEFGSYPVSPEDRYEMPSE